MKLYGGGGSTGPHIHLGTRQTRVIAFLPQPLHHKYHMNTKLGAPQRQPGCCGDQKKFLHCQNLNHYSLVCQPTGQLLQWLTFVIQCIAQRKASKCSVSWEIYQFWEHSLSVHKIPQLILILSQLNPVSILTLHWRFTLILLSNFHLWCSSGILNSVSLAKFLYWRFMSCMNSTCPPHLTFLHFVTMKLSAEQHTSLLQFNTSPSNSKHTSYELHTFMNAVTYSSTTYRSYCFISIEIHKCVTMLRYTYSACLLHIQWEKQCSDTKDLSGW